jgi:hypothetical protein
MLHSEIYTRTASARRRWTATGLAKLLRRQRPTPVPPALGSPALSFPGFEPPMPAIVLRAQTDARCRAALKRLGYVKARSRYARDRRDGRETFAGLRHEGLAPTMEFVRLWLAEERKRIVTATRWPFLMTMLATILAGVVFAGVARLLG